MSAPGREEVTELLKKWSEGNEEALEELTPLIYAELYRIAKLYMARERQGHTLQTSALVNEAFIRLVDWKNAKFENRAHFLGISARLMRQILVDFARKRPRSGEEKLRQVSIEEAIILPNERNSDIIALDEALSGLARFDERKAKIVEMKFFGGLSVEEIAEVMNISGVTVMREWSKAKSWLYLELKKA